MHVARGEASLSEREPRSVDLPSDRPREAISDPEAPSAPVSGSCARCGGPLGYGASMREGIWYCCGGCADSGRCTCGASSLGSDRYVPTRRMFASRHPDELRGADARTHLRAFPFAEPRRGR